MICDGAEETKRFGSERGVLEAPFDQYRDTLDLTIYGRHTWPLFCTLLQTKTVMTQGAQRCGGKRETKTGAVVMGLKASHAERGAK